MSLVSFSAFIQTMFCGTFVHFILLFTHFIIMIKTAEVRKNFIELIDHIQKDSKLVSINLADSIQKTIPEMTDLAKKDIVRRCNDQLQIQLIRELGDYSLMLHSAAQSFDSYSQSVEVKSPILLEYVRNAQWNDAWRIVQELDKFYTTAEAQTSSCYTKFKMILDVNNGFYEENRDLSALLIRFMALNMDEETCQERKSILLIAAITFIAIAIAITIIQFLIKPIEYRER